MAELHVPESWLALYRELEAPPSVVLTVGAGDTGKSTFCRWLAQRNAADGAASWLVDADVGQSQLGPPASIGCAPVDETGVREATAFFVGDVSPRRVPPAMLGALAEGLRMAREAGARSIVIDSTGWISGPEAVALKMAKAAVADEAHVVLIAQGDELRAFRRAWRGLPRFPTHVLRPVPEVSRRSPEERRARREALFRAHLQGAVDCEIDLRHVAVSGTGRLHLPRPSVPPGLLLGLGDPGGRLLSLGILRELHAASGKLTCLCQPAGSAAAEVRFGRLLVAPDGAHSTASDDGEAA